MLELVSNVFGFILAAANCPGLQELAFLFLLVLVTIQTLSLSKRLGKVENVASVRDFLKNGKKKK